MFKKIDAWLLAHPGVIHVLEGLLYAVVAADIAYLKPLFVTGGTVPSLTVILAGVGSAAFVAFKLYAQTTISQNQGVIIAWAQDILEQAAPAVAAPVPGVVAIPAALKVTAKPASAALTPLKVVLFALGLSLLASSTFAWELPSTAIHLQSKVGGAYSAISPTAQGNDELDLIPTGAIGFGVGPTNAPSYGYSGSWDLVFDHASQSSTPGIANVAPYFGIGGSIYVDAAPYINSALQSPILIDAGVNVIGPQINGLVPTAELVWNLNSGNKTELLGLVAPFELLESTIIPVKQF